MPCIYAHNSFGKEVQKMLPKPLKNTIRRHPAAFRIGLQGPDFLFFYHPLLKCKTNQLGYHQHSHAFDAFLAYELPSSENLEQTLPPMPICSAISVILRSTANVIPISFQNLRKPEKIIW